MNDIAIDPNGSNVTAKTAKGELDVRFDVPIVPGIPATKTGSVGIRSTEGEGSEYAVSVIKDKVYVHHSEPGKSEDFSITDPVLAKSIADAVANTRTDLKLKDVEVTELSNLATTTFKDVKARGQDSNVR